MMARFPIAGNSDAIANRSTVPGDSVTDALDNLASGGGGDLQSAYDAGNEIVAAGGLAVVVKNEAGDPLAPLIGALDNAGTTEYFKVNKNGIASNAALSAKGDINYGNGVGNAVDTLPAGADGEVLTLAGGVPTWAAASGGGGLSPTALLQSPWLGIGIAQTSQSTTGMGARGYAASATYTDASSSLSMRNGVRMFVQQAGGGQCSMEGDPQIYMETKPIFMRRFWSALFPAGPSKEAMGMSINLADVGTFPSSLGNEEYSFKYSLSDFGNQNFWVVIVSNGGATTTTIDTGVLVPDAGAQFSMSISHPTSTTAHFMLLDATGAIVYEHTEVGLTISGTQFRPMIVGETVLDFGRISHVSWSFGTLEGTAL